MRESLHAAAPKDIQDIQFSPLNKNIMGIHHAIRNKRYRSKRHVVAQMHDISRLIERCGPIQTFMEAHTFSTIALHKSRLKSISRSPLGAVAVIRGNVHGKRRNPARVKLHIPVQIYTVSPFRRFANISWHQPAM